MLDRIGLIMDHADHVRLLQGALLADERSESAEFRGIWADIGSGTGAFTLALAELLGAQGELYSVDRDTGALRQQKQAMSEQFPTLNAHYVQADFTHPLQLPPLDGMIMANSLHFVRDSQKEAVVRQLRACLQRGGRLILVEYNVDRGNMWVPHPLSYPTWEKLAAASGFAYTRLAGRVPSRFLQEFYSAVSG
jgi:ubiquinone/menaquinone biosynthesis C-methylase UbiE